MEIQEPDHIVAVGDVKISAGIKNQLLRSHGNAGAQHRHGVAVGCSRAVTRNGVDVAIHGRCDAQRCQQRIQRRTGSAGNTDDTDSSAAGIGDVYIQIHIRDHTLRIIDLCRCGRPTVSYGCSVAAGSAGSITGKGMDVAHDIDDANLVVGGVGDIDIADSVAPCAAGIIDFSRCRCVAIPGRARCAVTRYQVQEAGGDFDLEYLVAGVVGNVDVARGVGSNAARLAQSDQGWRAAGGSCGHAGCARDFSGEVGNYAAGSDASHQRCAGVGEVDIAKGIGNHGAHIVACGEGDRGGLATVAVFIGGPGAGHIAAAGHCGPAARDGSHGIGQRNRIAL